MQRFAAHETDKDESNNRAPFNILLALRAVRHLMSAEEVGQIVNKSKFTIYRMARNNQIPHMWLAGSLCFDPSALEMWLIKKQPELAVAARHLMMAA